MKGGLLTLSPLLLSLVFFLSSLQEKDELRRLLNACVLACPSISAAFADEQFARLRIDKRGKVRTRSCTHARTRTHAHAHAHARPHTHAPPRRSTGKVRTCSRICERTFWNLLEPSGTFWLASGPAVA